MPLHYYRVQPALAVAFGALYRPGEWLLSLRARSEATSVSLRLSPGRARELWPALRQAALACASEAFPVRPTAPCPADSPRLLVPYDLEAVATEVEAARLPGRRLLGLLARGNVHDERFLAEIWGTPEQMLALAEQIEAALLEADAVCPACGATVGDGEHECRPEATHA